ncbi:hypothetical protein BKI52_14180 [marine bacterium AO1-C]|nr:hypothetical protein BKI52_14180 [marine bacterium AO1-C]
MEENTLLVVDDDKQSLQTINYYLQQSPEKYQVMSATNGALALQVLGKKIPELIITDWDMPHVNGLELIRRVKKNPATAHLPIIIITGINTTPENLQEALEVGADDFLRKPLNYVELYARTAATLKIYRYMRTIEQQKQDIAAQKHRELSSKTVELIQKREFLIEIRDKINAVLPKLKGTTKKEVHRIERAIQSNLNVQNSWEVFKVHFDNVHPHFFKNLLGACPALTQNDLKHCAYLKIGLSTKEIAHIFNISPNSVLTHHYRIKKKLSIDSDKKLIGYIQLIA